MKNETKRVLSEMHSWKVVDSHPDVPGMTTPKVRRLLNRLVAGLPQDESYLEIGVHMGGTLIPALSGHKSVDATAVDNWSQFAQVKGGHARDFFYQNLSKYQDSLPAIRVVDGDVWEFLKKPEFKKPVGILFYDGDHTEQDQRRIFSDIYPHLATEAIVIIDDYEHPPARAGTEAGLKDISVAKLETVIKARSDGFHNGLGIFWLSK